MATMYELWDVDAGNMVAIFEDEASALRSIRATLEDHGPPAVSTLALGAVEDDGTGIQLAAGNALIERATAAAIAHAD